MPILANHGELKLRQQNIRRRADTFNYMILLRIVNYKHKNAGEMWTDVFVKYTTAIYLFFVDSSRGLSSRRPNQLKPRDSLFLLAKIPLCVSSFVVEAY